MKENNPHPLKHFEIFERHSLRTTLARMWLSFYAAAVNDVGRATA